MNIFKLMKHVRQELGDSGTLSFTLTPSGIEVQVGFYDADEDYNSKTFHIVDADANDDVEELIAALVEDLSLEIEG